MSSKKEAKATKGKALGAMAGAGISLAPGTSSLQLGGQGIGPEPSTSRSMPDEGSDGWLQSHFSVDSIRLMVESLCPAVGQLTDQAARFLADDVTYRVKLILQDAEKFASHAKRKKLATNDVDYSLKNKNIPPLYGFHSDDFIPFRFASGGGRDLFFQDADKEIDLEDMVTNSNILPKLPAQVALKGHWLSINGIQPAIPENPPPLSRDEQKSEAVDPAMSLKEVKEKQRENRHNLALKKQLELVQVKQLATHELSVEQQLYYKEITEACVGSDESKRHEALQSLTYDSGLHQMLPRLTTFIAEGVKVNVVQNNLALLIYLMRMVKALLDNQTLYLEKYLHELIPTVITCIVSKQLCSRPDVDNHWALRDFASRLLSQMCKNFNTSTNQLQVRVTRLLSSALDNEKLPLSSHYGAISALCELGPEVQKAFLFRRIKPIGERIRLCLEMPSMPVDKSAAEHIKQVILRVIPNTIKQSRPTPDLLEDYRQEFGYFGPILHSTVCRLRNVPGPGVQTTTTIGAITGTTAGQPRLTSMPSLLRPGGSSPHTSLASPVAGIPQQRPSQPMARLPGMPGTATIIRPITNTPGGQRFTMITAPPSTSTASPGGAPTGQRLVFMGHSSSTSLIAQSTPPHTLQHGDSNHSES